LVFAVHPLHVESVAWVTERKDVLSALFFFLALLGYLRYSACPSLGRYLLVVVPFVLGLLAKPMLVTFPFLLFLMDFWPLRRPPGWRFVWEKVPLLLVCAADAVVTYWVQLVLGGQQTIPLATRVSNSMLSYIIYVRQLFWPSRLAVFYPYPQAIGAFPVCISAAVLLFVSALVISTRRTRPWLAVGWFWYVGMLIPVIGFIQSGYQAHADHFAYLPSVGISIMLAWGGVDLCERWPKTVPVVLAAGGLLVVLCTAIAWRQASYWEDNEKLYQHAIEVTENNWLAHGNLGTYLKEIPERRAEGIGHLETALRIRPLYPEAQNNLGASLASVGLCALAIPHFETALRVTPNEVVANTNLGLCLLDEGRYVEAANRFEKVLSSQPNNLRARINLGTSLSKVPGRRAEAIAHFKMALKLSPDDPEAHRGLALILESRQN
jgi:tetratricopeptide (TPR) repeat protein